MYILIRNRIQEMPSESFDLRLLNTYAKILSEILTTLNEKTFWTVEEYSSALKEINEYLKQPPIYTRIYFSQSQEKLINLLSKLIAALSAKGEIIPESDYQDNLQDEINLFLAMYELEHISLFELQPIKSKTYYPHGRLKDNFYISGYRKIVFNDSSPLTEGMKNDISEQIDFLVKKYGY